MRKQCEYIGCNSKAVKKVEYEIFPDNRVECQVCSDHQELIQENGMLSARESLPYKLKAYDDFR